MTDPNESLPEPSFQETKQKSGARKKPYFVIMVGTALFAVACFLIMPWLFHANTVVSVSGGEEVMQARMESLEARLKIVEDRTELAVPANMAGVVTEASKPEAAPSAETAHIQSDLIALTSAMAALQSEVKATGASTAEVRDNANALVASVVAFLQLRDAVASGRSFADELTMMHDASRNDAALQALLGKLEPVAPTGAPTIDALHDELLQRQPSVAVAIAKSSAQHWWERVLAELQGLVTVRPIHGGEGDALAELETAVTTKSATALDVFKTLPDGAQKDLADWQKKLEIRKQADDVMHDIVRHYTTLSQVKTP